jgi:hypothetical protein
LVSQYFIALHLFNGGIKCYNYNYYFFLIFIDKFLCFNIPLSRFPSLSRNKKIKSIFLNTIRSLSQRFIYIYVAYSPFKLVPNERSTNTKQTQTHNHAQTDIQNIWDLFFLPPQIEHNINKRKQYGTKQ